MPWLYHLKYSDKPVSLCYSTRKNSNVKQSEYLKLKGLFVCACIRIIDLFI